MLWNLYHDICDTIIQLYRDHDTCDTIIGLYQDNVCIKRQYEQHKLEEYTQSEIVFRIET